MQAGQVHQGTLHFMVAGALSIYPCNNYNIKTTAKAFLI